MADKIDLSTVNTLARIDNAFQEVATELNDKVLYRVNPDGTANQMENQIDMNSNRIINLPEPLSDNEPARVKDVQNIIAGVSPASFLPFSPVDLITATNVQDAIRQAADTDHTKYVDRLGVTYLKTTSDILNGAEVSVERFIDETKWSGIQNRTSTYDCYNDIRKALLASKSVYFPYGLYKGTGNLPVLAGGKIRGDGGGEYAVLTGFENGATTFERQDLGTDSIISLGVGANAEHLMVRGIDYNLVGYTFANYPSGTRNTQVGIQCSTGSSAKHVTALSLPVGFALGTTTSMERCFAFQCDRGYYNTSASDGLLLGCVGMFCHTAGADLSQANFWQVIGGRWEWNARYGITTGGEGVTVGNIFDRNGWAGLNLTAGAWGHTVTGNYFSRNGAGGNGTLGRWSFSTPTDISYLATSATDSCHIKFNFQRAVTITSNRFRPGGADDGGGATSPCYVYNADGANLSTPVSDLVIASNVGDFANAVIPGFNAASYGGIGAVAGGTDNNAAFFINTLALSHDQRIVSATNGVNANGSGSVITIPLPAFSSGKVLLRSTVFNNSGLSEIFFFTNTINTGGGTTINNINGSNVTSATLATASTGNTLTINLSGSFFTNYKVEII